MPNRHETRKIEKVKRKEKSIPNLSGATANCGNCKFSVPRELHEKVIEALAFNDQLNGRTMTQELPKDQVHCVFNPTDVTKFMWAWCSNHEKRITIYGE